MKTGVRFVQDVKVDAAVGIADTGIYVIPTQKDDIQRSGTIYGFKYNGLTETLSVVYTASLFTTTVYENVNMDTAKEFLMAPWRGTTREEYLSSVITPFRLGKVLHN